MKRFETFIMSALTSNTLKYTIFYTVNLLFLLNNLQEFFCAATVYTYLQIIVIKLPMYRLYDLCEGFLQSLVTWSNFLDLAGLP